MNNDMRVISDAAQLSAEEMKTVVGGLRSEWMDAPESSDLKAQWMDDTDGDG